MTRFAAFCPLKKREELLLFRLRAFIAQPSLHIDFLGPHLWDPQRTDLDRNAHLTGQFDPTLTPSGLITGESHSFPSFSFRINLVA